MVSNEMRELFDRLGSTASDELLAAIIDIRRLIPEMTTEQKGEAAAALASLFYVDPNDRPDLEPIVDQAVRAVVALGPELIPAHLDEMRAADFLALVRYAQVLAQFGEEAVDRILETARGSSDPHLLLGAVYALSKIRDVSRFKALDFVIEHCRSDDADLRQGAVRAAGKFVEHLPGDALGVDQRKALFEALAGATNDLQPAVRAKGIRGIGKMARERLLDDAQRGRALERVEGILGERDPEQWDRAFIVRREANEAREYLSR